jgi:hypothetical protein
MNWVRGYELIFGLGLGPIRSDSCYQVEGAGSHLAAGSIRDAGWLGRVGRARRGQGAGGLVLG